MIDIGDVEYEIKIDADKRGYIISGTHGLIKVEKNITKIELHFDAIEVYKSIILDDINQIYDMINQEENS